jgi:hypothetical protein
LSAGRKSPVPRTPIIENSRIFACAYPSGFRLGMGRKSPPFAQTRQQVCLYFWLFPVQAVGISFREGLGRIHFPGGKRKRGIRSECPVLHSLLVCSGLAFLPGRFAPNDVMEPFDFLPHGRGKRLSPLHFVVDSLPFVRSSSIGSAARATSNIWSTTEFKSPSSQCILQMISGRRQSWPGERIRIEASHHFDDLAEDWNLRTAARMSAERGWLRMLLSRLIPNCVFSPPSQN